MYTVRKPWNQGRKWPRWPNCGISSKKQSAREYHSIYYRLYWFLRGSAVMAVGSDTKYKKTLDISEHPLNVPVGSQTSTGTTLWHNPSLQNRRGHGKNENKRCDMWLLQLCEILEIESLRSIEPNNLFCEHIHMCFCVCVDTVPAELIQGQVQSTRALTSATTVITCFHMPNINLTFLGQDEWTLIL